MYDIPDDYIINDLRDINELNNKSFSGFKTSEVLKVYKKCLIENKIEESVDWAIELIVSLQFTKIYDILLSVYIKNIHINNPNLPYKFFNRYKILKNSTLNLYELRNTQVIRNHIIELTIIICNSKKSYTLNLPKIMNNEFDLTLIISKLSANKDIINIYYSKNDPIELKIIFNEFIFSLRQKNYEVCIYWITWIITYEKLNKKKKKKIIADNRHNELIDKKYFNDIIWIFWDILLKESSQLSENSKYQIYYLYNLYSIFFSHSNKNKYIFLLFMTIKYFTNESNIILENIPISSDYYLIIQIVAKINSFFKEKKIFEVLKSNKIDQIKKDKIDKKIKKMNEKFNFMYNIPDSS